MKFSTQPVTELERLEAKAIRARGLARQATEERQRLERMLVDAKEKEAVACNVALKAEAATGTFDRAVDNVVHDE